jgi:hypothetical protein
LLGCQPLVFGAIKAHPHVAADECLIRGKYAVRAALHATAPEQGHLLQHLKLAELLTDLNLVHASLLVPFGCLIHVAFAALRRGVCFGAGTAATVVEVTR